MRAWVAEATTPFCLVDRHAVALRRADVAALTFPARGAAAAVVNAQAGSACSIVGARRTFGEARATTTAGIVHAREAGFTIDVAVTEFSGLGVTLTETIAGAFTIAVGVLETRHHRVARSYGSLAGRVVDDWLPARWAQWVGIPARSGFTQRVVTDTGPGTVASTWRILDAITERIVLAVIGEIGNTVVIATPTPAATAVWVRTASQWVQSGIDIAIARSVALDVVLAGTRRGTASALGAFGVDTLALTLVTVEIIDADVAVVALSAGVAGPCGVAQRRVADEARIVCVWGASRHAPDAVDAAESRLDGAAVAAAVVRQRVAVIAGFAVGAHKAVSTSGLLAASAFVGVVVVIIAILLTHENQAVATCGEPTRRCAPCVVRVLLPQVALLGPFDPAVATDGVKADPLVAILTSVAILESVARCPTLRLDANEVVWALLSALRTGLACPR